MNHGPRLSVAIPDSSLSDQQSKRDKTIKISQFARAFAIFRIRDVYVYHDHTITSSNNNDLDLLLTVLRYLDTPQYLRRILFSRINQLEYAGILHPIKAPHHKPEENLKNIKIGDIRVGVIVKVRGLSFVDLGLRSLIRFFGEGAEGKKVNAKFISAYPDLSTVEASENEIAKYYWGYNVQQTPRLGSLIKNSRNSVIVIASRKGSYLSNKEDVLLKRIKLLNNLLVVFGSPRRDVDEILAKESEKTNIEFMINLFPFQGTETVRLEEAILGGLSILNYVIYKHL
jgi:predicted SPOUT superfamily RNA methylase MTH1